MLERRCARLTRYRIPESRLAVLTDCDQALSIRAPRNAVDACVVREKRRERFTRARFPDTRASPFAAARPLAPSEQPSAVRAPRDRDVFIPWQGWKRLAVHGIPHLRAAATRLDDDARSIRAPSRLKRVGD